MRSLTDFMERPLVGAVLGRHRHRHRPGDFSGGCSVRGGDFCWPPAGTSRGHQRGPHLAASEDFFMATDKSLSPEELRPGRRSACGMRGGDGGRCRNLGCSTRFSQAELLEHPPGPGQLGVGGEEDLQPGLLGLAQAGRPGAGMRKPVAGHLGVAGLTRPRAPGAGWAGQRRLSTSSTRQGGERRWAPTWVAQSRNCRPGPPTAPFADDSERGCPVKGSGGGCSDERWPKEPRRAARQGFENRLVAELGQRCARISGDIYEPTMRDITGECRQAC